jgi:uncharacterized protein (TIGR02594 family)
MTFKLTTTEPTTTTRTTTTTKPTRRFSKAFALAAMIATAIVLSQTTAEARRYKQKTVRHHVTATAPVSGGIHGSGNQYAHLAHGSAAAPAKRSARNARQWRNAGATATRATRAHSSRVTRAARRSYAAVQPTAGMASGMGSGMAMGMGSSGLVAKARSYLGTNPTGMSAAWCARFMNMVLERSGRRGTGSNMARSFANYGRRVSGPQVGAIAVMSRGRGGGHVGIVSGIDKSGNPIIISGNHNRRVGEAAYPRGRIYAYVMP